MKGQGRLLLTVESQGQMSSCGGSTGFGQSSSWDHCDKNHKWMLNLGDNFDQKKDICMVFLSTTEKKTVYIGERGQCLDQIIKIDITNKGQK